MGIKETKEWGGKIIHRTTCWNAQCIRKKMKSIKNNQVKLIKLKNTSTWLLKIFKDIFSLL